LNIWSRTLIIFTIIFILIGFACYVSGVYSPAAVSVELFALVAFFDVVLGMLPSIAIAPHFPTIITLIIMIAILWREGM
jgi:hypothetical protein